MKYALLSIIALICLLSVSLCASRVLAFADEPDTIGQSFPYPEVEEDSDGWQEVGSFEALCAKLKQMKNTGGKLRLTADITVPADASFEFQSSGKNSSPVKLDVGAHTITVMGDLSFCLYMEIVGQGGDEGIFRVKPGGFLSLYSVSVEAQNGFAIRQDNGAVLLYDRLMDGLPDFICIGAIEKGAPIAIPIYGERFKERFQFVRLGEEAKLPERVEGVIIENGKKSDVRELPVRWHVEEASDALAARERCTVSGNFAEGLDTAVEPRYLLVFESDGSATMLQCKTRSIGSEMEITVYVDLRDPLAQAQLEWSQDGKSWEVAENGDIKQGEDGDFYTVSFIPVNQYPIYLSCAVTEPDGNKGYSDVVLIESSDGNGIIGGNRGGGTGIGNPILPPGENGQPDDSLPNVSNPTDPEADAPSVDTEITESPLPGYKAPTSGKRTPTAHTNPPVVPETPAPSTPENIRSTVISPAAGVNEGSSAEQQPESAVIPDNPATEPALAHVSQQDIPSAPIPETTSFSNKAVLQTAAGAVLVVAVMAAATWSPTTGWGKRLKSRLSKRGVH